MRLWLSGPRILRGLIRPGISFSGRELSAMGRKAPAIKADAMLGLFRRADDQETQGSGADAGGGLGDQRELSGEQAASFRPLYQARAARGGGLISLSKGGSGSSLP